MLGIMQCNANRCSLNVQGTWHHRRGHFGLGSGKGHFCAADSVSEHFCMLHVTSKAIVIWWAVHGFALYKWPYRLMLRSWHCIIEVDLCFICRAYMTSCQSETYER